MFFNGITYYFQILLKHQVETLALSYYFYQYYV